MTVPDWWETLILGLAAWRVFHLLAFDDLLDRPRRYVTRISPTWKKDGDPVGLRYRQGFVAFLNCPFCLGFWVALAWWGAWQAWPHTTLVAATPLMLSGVLVAAQRYLSSE